MQDFIKEGKITSKTLDRVKIAKSYIEKKYNLRRKEYEDKKKGKKKTKNIKKHFKKNRLGFNKKKIKRIRYFRRAKRRITSKFSSSRSRANASNAKKNVNKRI